MTDAPVDLLEAPPGVGPAEFARRLLSRGEVAAVRGPLKRVRTKGTPPRTLALKDMAIRATIGWIARSGGWQVRAVVSGGRRREGRIWASGIWEGIDLRFSAAALELLARSAAAAAQPQGFTLRRLESALAGLAPATVGDAILFHVVLEPLLDAALAREPAPKPQKPAEEEAPAPEPAPFRGATRIHARQLDRPDDKKKDEKVEKKKPVATPPVPAPEPPRARAIIELSPWTALVRADELEAPASCKEDVQSRALYGKRFAPLVQGDRAVLLTYLDDSIARRWIAREAQRRATPIGAAGAQRYAAFACALEGLGEAALAAGRPDALRPISRFFEQYVVKFGQREAVSRDLRERVHAAIPLASDRAAALARVARVFESSRLLEATAERILDTPFVDRTEPEKVFVAEFQDRMRPVRPELEAIRRELSGEVG